MRLDRFFCVLLLTVCTSLSALSATEDDMGWLRERYNLSEALLKQDKTIQAIAEMELTVNDARVRFGVKISQYGTTLLMLAEFLRKVGNLQMALVFHKQGLDIFEESLGRNHPRTLVANDVYGRILYLNKDYDAAESVTLTTLSIAEELYGKTDGRVFYAIDLLSEILEESGNLEKARPLLERARREHPRVTEDDKTKLLVMLARLERILLEGDEFTELVSLQRELLDLNSFVNGKEHQWTIQSNLDLAFALITTGQLNEARRTLLAYIERDDSKSKVLTVNDARAHELMSVLSIQLNDNDQARRHAEESLRIYEMIRGPHDADAIRLSVTVANAVGRVDLGAAIALLEKILTDSIEYLSPWDLFNIYGNLGIFNFQMGNTDIAIILMKQAREVIINGNVKSNLRQAAIDFSLGRMFLEIGKRELARSHLTSALPRIEQVLGMDHHQIGSVFATIAELYKKEKKIDLSIVMNKIAVNIFQTNRWRMKSLGENELIRYSDHVAFTYQELADLLTSQGRLAEAQMVLDMLKEDEQFDFIRRSAGADPRRTRIGYTPTEERWMSRYREIADRLAALGREEQALQKQAKLGLSDEQKKRQAALAADLKVAQAAFEAFLEQMRQEFATKGPARSVEIAESSVKALAELQDLLNGLGDDVALLRIYLTDEQVNFLLTTPGVQLARNVKIKTQDLNRQVAELNRLLRDPKSDPLPAAQALYKLLLAPVEQDLQQAGAKTVMLSLDGVLRYLPFGVLHDGQRYALQRWNLPIYTSVVRDRLRDAANANWQAAGLGVTRKHGNFDPLPAVRAEMSSIIRTGATGVLPGEVHLDEAFTAQRLKDVSQRRFPVVHVASHFQFSPGTEVNSFLLLGDGTQLTLGDIRTQNYRFDDVDLLTLSACETGLGGGRDQRGREIEGFGVIAQQQGAKAVLATLWKVADSSTATLMGDMYRRRTQSGLSKIEALRQAQVALAAQPRFAHPFYWAPFVLMGNWK